MKYAFQRKQLRIQPGETRVLDVHDDATIIDVHKVNDRMIEVYVMLALVPETDTSDE